MSSKGLLIESWSKSVTDGHKADVLALFGPNLLLEMHTIVYLGNCKTWTTLAKQGKTHYKEIVHCDMHLAYVGRGLYVEIVPRNTPLQVVDDTATSQSLVISKIKTLTHDEVKAFDQVQRLGLGFGTESKSILSASAGSAADLPRVEKELAESTGSRATTSCMEKPPVITPSTSHKKDSPLDTKELAVIVRKTEFNDPRQVWNITPMELTQLPLSRYRVGNYYPIMESRTPPSVLEITDEHYSTDTEIYWPLEE